MDSNQLESILAMPRVSSRLSFEGLLLIALAHTCFGQAPDGGLDAREVLQLSDREQIELVTTVLDNGLPDATGDKFSLLLVNRSWLVVPLIQKSIEAEFRRSSGRSERFVEIAATMIAYAGDEFSLRAISLLMAADEARFERYVERTLDSALGWRNPFSVAYSGVQIGDARMTAYIVEWCDNALLADRMKKLWASALVERYGRVPNHDEWGRDPLAARLKDSPEKALRRAVMHYAEEAAPKR